jgi:DNA-binding NarL/FixJ family response regulator
VSRLISLILIDDNRLSREGVVALIRTRPDFRLLVASKDSTQALARVLEFRPQVVLLNLRQAGDDSLTLAGMLHGEAPASRVIIMGLEPLQTDVASFVRAGVAGFIMADASIDAVLGTIQSAARGIQVLPPELTHSMFGQLKRDGVRRRPPRPLAFKRLTMREREIARLMVRGRSNKEIAAGLRIAIGTVKHYVHRVLSKLEVENRLDVATFSQRRAPGAGVPSPPADGHDGSVELPGLVPSS